MISLTKKNIKPWLVGVIVCMLMHTAGLAQIISSATDIVLPDGSSSLIIASGQVVKYKSALSISLNPGVTIDRGAEVDFSIQPVSVNDLQNWKLTRAFGINGAVNAETRSFYDEGGTLLQLQKRDMVSGNVLASQIINDYLGRPVLRTLMAPTLKNTMEYQPDFVQNVAGGSYTAANFDGAKLNAPDVVGNANRGTLGWYYSNNNTLEPYVGATSYPYIMVDYYNDGSKEMRKQSNVGEQMRMGSGHEQRKFSTIVVSELNHYLTVRNKFFTTAELGALPSALAFPATQIFSRNQNGQEIISITDNQGNVLMEARPGTGMTINNSYTFPNNSSYFFRIFAPTVVNYGGSYAFTVYDMTTEQPVSIASGGTLPAGYYKIVKGAFTGSGGVGLSPYFNYSTNFSNVSYKFYNQHGQLVASIPVEGVNRLQGTGINNYSSRADIPYISQKEYNFRGLLSAVSNRESGRTEYAYRSDGKLRFSQNALQRASGKYSYINYDNFERIIERGEFTPGTGGITFKTVGMSNLESVSADGGLGVGSRTDWTKKVYDIPSTTGVAGYVQDAIFLGGAVSTSENSAGAKTWYNYDDQHQLTWSVQNIPGLGLKTTDYTYDVVGNVTKRIFQKNTAAETFVQYFEYDQNLRLSAVYTSITDNPAAKTIQAKYSYYLHGPLKRVELGGNVQGIDYTYTPSGTLKAINNSNRDQDPGKDGISGLNTNFGKDAFGMNVDYYNQDYTRNSTGIGSIPVNSTYAIDQFNGNARSISWHSRKPASIIASAGVAIENPTMYAYSYDSQSQLLNATWGAPDFNASPGFNASTAYAEKIQNYDGNGNISTLQRTDGAGSQTENLTYTYTANTNQLQSVKNAGSQYRSYAYDVLGRLTAETAAGSPTRYIKYDVASRVLGVYGDAAFTQAKVTFTYNEKGQRIVKKDLVNNTTTYYANDLDGKSLAIFTQAGAAAPVETELPVFAGTRVGIFRKATASYEYELTDHLGNVRAVIDGSKAIKQYGDYYPFGSIARNGGTNNYRFGYQGQNSETDPETGWSAFHLRMYDSKIGRWITTDPKKQYVSAYLGMGNNPVNGQDNDGGAFWNFWEASNARQAREFAARTGTTFDKWKGEDKKTWASASIGGYSAVFAPNSQHYDWLRSVGVPTYTAELMTMSGWDYVGEMARIGDAWANGSGEYYRGGEAPPTMKALIGMNPIFCITNNLKGMVFSNDHTDFLGNKYETTSDYVWGWAGVVFSVGTGNLTRLGGVIARAPRGARVFMVADKLDGVDLGATFVSAIRDTQIPQDAYNAITAPKAEPVPLP